MKVTELYIYPIKSMGGIKVDSLEITKDGIKWDRKFMLIHKKDYTFVT